MIPNLLSGPADPQAPLARLLQSGTLNLTLPADWATQRPPDVWSTPPATSADKEITAFAWIGLKIKNPTSTALTIGFGPFGTLPNLKSVLLVAPDQTATFSYKDVTVSFVPAGAAGLTFTILPNSQAQLCLGFSAVAASLALAVKLLRPAPPSVSWSFSSGSDSPAAWKMLTISDAQAPVALLRQNGDLRLTVPLAPTWAKQSPTNWVTAPVPALPATPVPLTQAVGVPVADSLAWLGLSVTNPGTSPLQVGLDYVLFNSVSARTALTLTGTSLDVTPLPPSSPLGGVGAPVLSNGQPYQAFALKNRPLFNRPGRGNPYDHLVVQVDGQVWTQADDFPPGPGQLYRINPVTGEFSFGSYDATTPGGSVGHGTIPPKGVTIAVTSYRYVAAGAAGNVGAGSVGSLRTLARHHRRDEPVLGL